MPLIFLKSFHLSGPKLVLLVYYIKFQSNDTKRSLGTLVHLRTLFIDYNNYIMPIQVKSVKPAHYVQD